MSNFMKIAISIFVTIIVVGGGVYYFMNRQATDDKAGLQTQIDSLNKQVTDLKTTTTSTATTTIPVATDETASWKTYTNSTYGFSVKYPADWTTKEAGGSNYDKSVVSLASPETTAAFQAANGQEGAYSDDISIYYYASVADEAENKANSLGATTIDQLIQKNDAIKKIGSTAIGGVAATDVYWGGLGSYYAILVTKNNHLFKIWFNNISDKGKLTTIEKTILSTFQFTQ